MEGDGLRAEGEFLAFIWFVSRTTGESRVRRTLVVSGCWISFLMGIFAFKSSKVEVWFQLECAPEQLIFMVTADGYFYVATFFPAVSELDYLLLDDVVVSNDLDFCLWKLLQQRGSLQILRCFGIDWNQNNTNNESFLLR